MSITLKKSGNVAEQPATNELLQEKVRIMSLTRSKMIVDAGVAYLKKKNSFWASDNREVMLNGRKSAQKG